MSGGISQTVIEDLHYIRAASITTGTVSSPSGTEPTVRESSVVHRLGYGTLQLTGTGVWGEPEDPNEAVRVLGRAVEPGVDFIDTADSYDLWRSWENLETAREPLQADSDRHGISIDRSSWTRRGARSSERC